MAEHVIIERLGARGDGVAETASGSLHVPYALPGEAGLIEREGRRGRIVVIETASPDRVEPFCPYFGACGGCATQHMGDGLYRAWKHDMVALALAQARIEIAPDDLIDAHGEGRRRITLHARHAQGQARVGYMAARSHDLIEIARCPIAEPALVGAPAAASALAGALRRLRKPLDLQVTASEAGLDIDIRGHGPVDARERQLLVEAAGELDLARLSLHGEVVVERRPPTHRMGPARVTPPPGAFLQATREGEERLAEIVIAACGPARRVADLFAGCGPFALRLAQGREVHAVESDALALAALDRAARATPGLRRVTIEARDLFRRPLLGPELDGFDAVVIDPPRAGAEAQAKQLAISRVPLVASVSCDAGTFARDAAILLAGGYGLERVVLVDQFKYSPHAELVGLFRRPATKRRR